MSQLLVNFFRNVPAAFLKPHKKSEVITAARLVPEHTIIEITNGATIEDYLRTYPFLNQEILFYHIAKKTRSKYWKEFVKEESSTPTLTEYVVLLNKAYSFTLALYDKKQKDILGVYFKSIGLNPKQNQLPRKDILSHIQQELKENTNHLTLNVSLPKRHLLEILNIRFTQTIMNDTDLNQASFTMIIWKTYDKLIWKILTKMYRDYLYSCKIRGIKPFNKQGLFGI